MRQSLIEGVINLSRSYKHFPFCKDVKSSKWGKRLCNKRIRKLKDIPSGKAYCRMNEKWDYIYDYCHSETWKSYKQWCERPRWWREPEKADYFEWYKTYKMK